jgi:hypothetical protein
MQAWRHCRLATLEVSGMSIRIYSLWTPAHGIVWVSKRRSADG